MVAVSATMSLNKITFCAENCGERKPLVVYDCLYVFYENINPMGIRIGVCFDSESQHHSPPAIA
jgi:hypothetical protein